MIETNTYLQELLYSSKTAAKTLSLYQCLIEVHIKTVKIVCTWFNY